MSKRSSSSKLFFYDLHGLGAKVQVMADARYLVIFFPYVCLLIETCSCLVVAFRQHTSKCKLMYLCIMSSILYPLHEYKPQFLLILMLLCYTFFRSYAYQIFVQLHIHCFIHSQVILK
jgi:hypothetical protein